MHHRVKKIKFKKGKDATRATLRKLALNFIKHGKIETTLSRAKILKSLMDKLVAKAKKKTEATKNFLLRRLGEKEAIEKLFNTIAPSFNDRESGFVKLIKLLPRLGDGIGMARLEWVKPIVSVKSSKLKVKNTQEKQKENAKSNQGNKTGKRKRNKTSVASL